MFHSLLRSRSSLSGRLLAVVWFVFAYSCILLAVVITVGRLLLPGVGQYREDILNWVNSQVQQTVDASRVRANIRGLRPWIEFQDVRVLGAETNGAALDIDSVRIEVDLLASLWKQRLVPSVVALSGSTLTVVRRVDGSVFLEGLRPGGGASGAGAERFWAWVFAQNHLVMESLAVNYRIEGDSARQIRLPDVALDLRNSGRRHQMDGLVTLPEELGRTVSFALDLQGDSIDPLAWEGELYLNATDLHISRWLPRQILAGASVLDGVASWSMWGQWRDHRVQSLEGEFSGHHLQLDVQPLVLGLRRAAAPEADAKGAMSISAVAGVFGWLRDSQGWSLGIDRFVIMHEGQAWLPSRVDVTLTRADTATLLEIGMSAMRAQDAFELLSAGGFIGSELEEARQALQPTADLFGTLIRYTYAKDAPREFLFSTHVHNLGLLSWQGIPEASGLDGWVIFDGRAGAVEFNALSAQVDVPHLFDHPLTADSVTGQLRWARGENGWQISGRDLQVTNTDVTVRGDVDILLPDTDQSAFLYLIADIADAQVGQTSRYLPTRVMRKSISSWLQRALGEGRISTGQVLFHGRLAEFPFDSGQGRFGVHADLVGVNLDYAEQWPGLQDIAAQLRFDQRRMVLDAQRAHIVGADVGSTQAVIPDLGAKRPVLRVTGRVRGLASDGLRFLSTSPLRDLFGDYIEEVSASGPIQVSIDLTRPFYGSEEQKLAGTVDLHGVALDISKGVADATALQGVLKFTGESVSAEGLSGIVMQQSATGGMQTVVLPSGPAVVVSAHGQSSASELRHLLSYSTLEDLAPIIGVVDGETSWSATLTLPRRAVGETEAAARLRVDTPLAGLSIPLPEPLGKTGQEPRALSVEIPLPGAPDRPIRVAYGDALTAIFSTGPADAAETYFERGELRFGGDLAELPAHAGLRLAGRMPRLSATQWWSAQPQEGSSGAEDFFSMINELDLVIDSLEVFGEQINDITVQATKADETWQGRVQGREIAGKVALPLNEQSPVEFDLDYLRLPARTPGPSDLPLDPRSWPSMRIRSRELKIGSADFGALDAVLEKRFTGLHLDKLELASGHTRISSQGDWITVNKRQSSSFHFTVTTSDLGKAMSLFGYADTIEGGRCGCEFILHWPGSPMSFPVNQMGGILRLHIKKGRFVEIEPGAGRIFGLLNMQAISRRLVLDFSDFFKKGFTFDSLSGEFTLEDGRAYTDGVVIKSPAADMEVKGQVGLASRDYDQVVTVVPNVGSTLPVAGALTGGFGAGVAILFLQKMLGASLDDIVRYQYTVTGSWDDPKIERIVQPRTDKPGGVKDEKK